MGDAANRPGATAARRLPWRIPAALGMTQVVHWGSLYYAFAVLAPAIEAELGQPRDAVAGAFSAGLLAQGAAALLAGPLMDRIGTRTVMTAGSLMAAAGLLLASQVATLWQLYLAWAAIGAVMALTLYEAAFAAVTAAFGPGAARRGIAVVTLAGGLASTVSWPLVSVLVVQEGWRATLVLLAAANAACAVPHRLVLRNSLPAGAAAGSGGAAAAGSTLRGVLGQARFWWLCAALLAVAFLGASMAVHLLPMLRAKGLDGTAALAVAGLLGPTQVAGRLLEASLGRRLPIRVVGLAALLALAGSLVALACAEAMAAAAIAVAAYGAANGILTIVRGAVPAEMFGARAYASIVGVVAAGNAVAAACGPVLAARLWDATGSPAAPILAMAAVAGAALLAFANATRKALPGRAGSIRAADADAAR